MMWRRRTFLAASALGAAPPEWRSILDQSIVHDEANFQLLRSYVFEIHDESRASRLPTETQTYEVNLVGPGMYFRKLKTNDRELNEEEKALEQKRLRIHLAQKAVSDQNAPWRGEREILKSWLAMHRFSFKGARRVDGRAAVLLESKATEALPNSMAFLSAARTRLTLDAETGHWIEAVFEIRRWTEYELHQLLMGRLSLPYSPGLINRGGLPAGSTLTIRLQRLEDGLWAPQFYRNERPGFLSELTFSKFRKFTSESQLLTDPE